ncbi:MAG: FeoB small GTPase domain-containing protein, partial [Methylophilus sp.]|nr:FeoB small GTPase domain-containing protein [Methylophilus sp.]
MKRIALLGMPNTGKSTLFNRLSGASARVGNWPGITVDLMSAKVLMGGHIAELIDLPGLYDLHGFSDDEQVVRHFLSNHAVDLVMIVLNSSQIDRQLSLALQIKQLGLPTMLLLNMQDEAKRAGITIDTEAMAGALGFPVQTISAKYGDGCPQALQLAGQVLNNPTSITAPQDIAKLLEVDSQIEQTMHDIVQHTVQMPIKFNDETTDQIDRVLLHPWLGLPLFFLAMFLLFQFIFTVGAPLQDGMAWILDTFRTEALEPMLAN